MNFSVNCLLPLNIAVVIGAGILAAVVIILLIWGISRHEEGGLLQVCWINDRANYIEGAEANKTCEKAKELRWPQSQIPITIAPMSFDGKKAGEKEVEALSSAMSDINRQLGFALLELGNKLQPSDAEAHLGEPFHSGKNTPPGHVQHRYTDTGELRAFMFIRSDMVEFRPVIQHELLHVAGLGHDQFPLSIMYPYSKRGVLNTNRPRIITDSDKKLLKALYNKE